MDADKEKAQGEKPGSILIVPSGEKGRGGGHFSRSVFLFNALLERGRGAFLFIPENVAGAPDLFTPRDTSRVLSRRESLLEKERGLIVLDNYRTNGKDFAFWSKRGVLIGIDEGGAFRGHFDFLVDLLPGVSSHAPNITSLPLLPLPRNRREENAPRAGKKTPVRVLISFGAEDAAGLGFYTAGVLSSALAGGRPAARQEVSVTLVSPSLSGKEIPDARKKLPGIEVLGKIPGLKERLADYDILITHFGLGAFEAVYARIGVVLFSPSAYHKKLAKSAGFTTGSRRLLERVFDRAFADTLIQRSREIARRYGIEKDQTEDFAAFIGGLSPRSPRECPVCGGDVSGEVLARFPERTYRLCRSCGVISLGRLTPPPIEYEKEYFFDFYKKQYGKTYLEDFPNLKEAALGRLARIKPLLETPAGRKPALLDIGCAYGPFLAAAAQSGYESAGVDPAEDAIRYVKEELKISARQGFFPGALSEKERAQTFDVVTLWYVIEHFEETGRALSEINAVLKTGGVLALSTPSFTGVSGRKSLYAFLEKSPGDHFTVWNPRACKRILKKYGFTLRETVVTGHHPERFPLAGRFVDARKKGALYRLLHLISRIFRLGDTFEAYAVKTREAA